MLAGDPALDFANTLHWRDGVEVDFLPDYHSLTEWSVPARLLSEEERGALLALAPGWTEVTAAAHAAAIALRGAWRRRLGERTGLLPPSAPDLDGAGALAPMLAAALADPQLLVSANPPEEGHPSRYLLLPIARIGLAIAGLELVPGDRKLGRCEGDPCGGFFLNTSRSKPRRWCSMDTCGNRAKVRGFRNRLVAEAVQEPKIV